MEGVVVVVVREKDLTTVISLQDYTSPCKHPNFGKQGLDPRTPKLPAACYIELLMMPKCHKKPIRGGVAQCTMHH